MSKTDSKSKLQEFNEKLSKTKMIFVSKIKSKLKWYYTSKNFNVFHK